MDNYYLGLVLFVGIFFVAGIILIFVTRWIFEIKKRVEISKKIVDELRQLKDTNKDIRILLSSILSNLEANRKQLDEK